MHVKTFQAPNMHEALEQVRRELGPDAILLANRKIPGPDGTSWVEISAALDRSDPVEPSQTDDPRDTSDAFPFLQEQLRDIQGLLSLLLSAQDVFSRLQSHPAVTELFQHLLLRGLNEKNAFEMVTRILKTFDNGSFSRRQVIDAFRSQLFDKIRVEDPFQGLDAKRSIPPMFTFLGPTGVGKTTTLAKLAAYLKYKRRCRVALVSLDTYRIGALDQLKTYAHILQTPFHVAQSHEALLSARERFRDHDVILVDTIGRNYLEPKHIQDLKDVFRHMDEVHHFLVLSATAKDEDTKNVVHRFRPLGVESLIFTKIDETLTPGTIVNAMIRFPYPVSYLGIGQRVPEDVVRATPKRIMGFFFPGAC